MAIAWTLKLPDPKTVTWKPLGGRNVCVSILCIIPGPAVVIIS